MGWARFDDRRATHPKLRKAGFAARGLDEAAICQVAADGTDGFISRETVNWLAGAHEERHVARLVARLVAVGRWIPTSTGTTGAPDGWLVHGYLDYNPSKEESAARTAKKRLAGQAGGQASATARASRSEALASASRLTDRQAVPSRPDPKGKTSSSSHSRGAPKPVEEEDDLYVKEAKRRLATTPTLVTNPTAWLAATIRGLRDDGWSPTLAARPAEPRLVLRDDRKPCDTCFSSGVVLNAEGFAERCPDCND